MRVLLIDDDAFFRALVKKFLERDLPDADVTSFLTSQDGFPPADLDWSACDVLLLGHDLAGALKGVDWLLGMRSTVDLPPVVYVTETGSDELAGQARKAGAHTVIRKDELSGDSLARTLEHVKQASHARPSTIIRQRYAKPSVPGFKVASQIGEGAKSRVYLAERELDGQTVVLKVIEVDLVNEHAFAKRFVEEAELLAELNSPYVVRVYEHGFSENYGFMAMEFLPRGDLKHRIELGLTHADALHCTANIAYGLQAIHTVGIVHRDLKPANVMFRHDDTLALADFGVALRLETESEFQKTGRVLGTPHYMSPEQGQGKPVDVRNDIYSLGVIFYEMLTGSKPYHGATPAALVYEHINTPIPLLPSRLRRYQSLINKLLAKDPVKRFQSATELLGAL